MRALIRSIALVAVAAAALVLAPGAAAAAPTRVDAVEFGWLPHGLGARSDFTYEYDDVAFVSAVWESRSDDGYRVDLNADALRGDRLSAPRALHDWFIAYEDRPPAEARYRPVRISGHRGWACRDEAFWLVRPGFAISVHLDRARWTRRDVLRLARSARVVPVAPS